MLKELFPGSTAFTVAIFKIPQISKHFSGMLNRIIAFYNRAPIGLSPLTSMSKINLVIVYKQLFWQSRRYVSCDLDHF